MSTPPTGVFSGADGAQFITRRPDADPDSEQRAYQVNVEGAVLLDSTYTVLTHTGPVGGQEGAVVGLELAGKVNKEDRRKAQLFLLDGDGAASLVAAVCEVFVRNGQGEEFMGAFQRELAGRLGAGPEHGRHEARRGDA